MATCCKSRKEQRRWTEVDDRLALQPQRFYKAQGLRVGSTRSVRMLSILNRRLQHFFLLLLWTCYFQACHPILQRRERVFDDALPSWDCTYLKMRATINYQKDGRCYSGADVNLRIKRDGCIWASVCLPWGMEIMRCLITPQGVTLVDHREKAYYAYDYATLRARWSGPWDHALLQALLLGELARPSAVPTSTRRGRQQVIRYRQGDWSLTYFVNPISRKVEKLVAQATPEGCKFTASYRVQQSDRAGSTLRQVTLQWHHNTKQEEPVMSAILKGIKVKHATKPLSFPLTIPTWYEERK